MPVIARKFTGGRQAMGDNAADDDLRHFLPPTDDYFWPASGASRMLLPVLFQHAYRAADYFADDADISDTIFFYGASFQFRAPEAALL